MTSLNKKKKCRNNNLINGGEKGGLFKMKREAIYHKKNRVANKKECIQYLKGLNEATKERGLI